MAERISATGARAKAAARGGAAHAFVGFAVRYVLTIVVLILFVLGLASIKACQIASLVSMGKKAEKAGPPPEAVSVGTATEETWPRELDAVGSVTAVKGVSISNDAPGIVVRIAFDSGQKVQAGQVLVQIDTSVERAQLASAQARRQLAAVTAERSRALLSTRAIAQAQSDADQTSLESAVKDVSALEAQIGRKIVRAPFAGRLGIRAVNLGQYVASGTPLTVLESTDAVFADFTLPQQQLPDVSVGVPVHVVAAGTPPIEADGTIAALDASIDASTRTFKLRATIPDPGDALRPGMYVTVRVELPGAQRRVVVPATAIVHAAYGDSVFVVENATARQQFVVPAAARGDFVALDRGLAAGQEIVTAGAFKLRNGAKITVVPDVKPAPQLHPHVQNR